MEMTCRRCGRTIQVADKESLVEEYIRRGELTREQAESHPQRSIITIASCPSCGEPLTGPGGD